MASMSLGLQLRLNKVSELIHNSAGRQNIEKASVMVHFQRILDRVRTVTTTTTNTIPIPCLPYMHASPQGCLIDGL